MHLRRPQQDGWTGVILSREQVQSGLDPSVNQTMSSSLSEWTLRYLYEGTSALSLLADL